MLCAEPPFTRLSPVRWFVLVVATALAGFQGAWWNNFGPISAAVKPFFGWSDVTIALLSAWGPICYFVAAPPTAWLLDVHGLRRSCMVGLGLTFCGSLFRCIRVAPDVSGAAFMHTGQILNGLAGPLAMSIAPVLSAAWRTTDRLALSWAAHRGRAQRAWCRRSSQRGREDLAARTRASVGCARWPWPCEASAALNSAHLHA